MIKFSRKIVLLLVILFAQSSLGTNAALKDFSNVSTKSLSQNGYYKLPDGLIIQWGLSDVAGSSRTIYLPVSFYDTYYSLVTNVTKSQGATMSVVSSSILSKTKSNFVVNGTYQYENGDYGYLQSTEKIYWLAIGRWK